MHAHARTQREGGREEGGRERTFARIWRVLFLSRRVAVSVLRVSKSIVTPKGMPISSVRAYRRPMEPLLSSTRCEIPRQRRLSAGGGGS